MNTSLRCFEQILLTFPSFKLVPVLVLCGLFMTVAFANGTETGKVTRIVVESDYVVSIWLDGTNYTAECSGGSRWTINRNQDALFDAKYAAILAAASSGKAIVLHHTTNWGCGPWVSNRVYYVSVSF